MTQPYDVNSFTMDTNLLPVVSMPPAFPIYTGIAVYTYYYKKKTRIVGCFKIFFYLSLCRNMNCKFNKHLSELQKRCCTVRLEVNTAVAHVVSGPRFGPLSSMVG